MVQLGVKLKRIRKNSPKIKWIKMSVRLTVLRCNISSSDPATKQIGGEQQQQIEEANQVSVAPPAKVAKKVSI